MWVVNSLTMVAYWLLRSSTKIARNHATHVWRMQSCSLMECSHIGSSGTRSDGRRLYTLLLLLDFPTDDVGYCPAFVPELGQRYWSQTQHRAGWKVSQYVTVQRTVRRRYRRVIMTLTRTAALSWVHGHLLYSTCMYTTLYMFVARTTENAWRVEKVRW
jgi:hypothetical protein